MLTYYTFSPQETYRLACRLGQKLKGGELIALEGDLGAGKTLFVKGLARGLEVTEPVTSPTFTLMNIYEGRLTLAHFDVYRLPGPQALEELGYEEHFYGAGVVAVEWSDLIKSYLPEEYLLVVMRREYHPEKGEARRITLVPYGPAMMTLLKELEKDDCAGD